VLAQAPVDHGRDQVVSDELAGGHAAPDLDAQLGVVLDVPAEDVTDVDVLEVKALGQELGVGAFSAALDAHDDVLAHPLTCPHASELGVLAGDWFNHAIGATAWTPPAHPSWPGLPTLPKRVDQTILDDCESPPLRQYR